MKAFQDVRADAMLLPVAQMLCSSATVACSLDALYYQLTATPCDTAMWTRMLLRERMMESHAAGLGRYPPSMTLWPLKKNNVIHEKRQVNADPIRPSAPSTGKRVRILADTFWSSWPSSHGKKPPR